MSYNRRQAAIIHAFGLNPANHLPAEGMAPRVIDGVLTWIVPAPAQRPLFHAPKHRVMARCPVCEVTMSAARMPQHTGTDACMVNADRRARKLARELARAR